VSIWVKTPAADGSQVVELRDVASEGSKDTVSVTMLSHPNWLINAITKTPAAEGSQVDEVIKDESCAEKVTVVMMRLSQPCDDINNSSNTPILAGLQDVVNRAVVSDNPCVTVLMTR